MLWALDTRQQNKMPYEEDINKREKSVLQDSTDGGENIFPGKI